MDPALWNLKGVTRRTNNNLEGWHARLNRLIGKAHPNLFQFLETIVQEQGSTETLLLQIQAGNPPLVGKPKYKAVNSALTKYYSL